MSDQLAANFLGRTVRRNASADYGERLSQQLRLKGVLLDDHQKGTQAKQRRQKRLYRDHKDFQRPLLNRKRRKAIFAEAYRQCGGPNAYKSLEGLRRIWVQYAASTCQRLKVDLTEFLPTKASKELPVVAQRLEAGRKVVGALEFHGCELEVLPLEQALTKRELLKGTVIGNTKNTFVLVSREDKVVKVIKKGRQFRFVIDGCMVSFCGDQLI